ncbi:aminoacyl-tRNA hydrolase [Leptospira meyeri]|uniref:aminoacyl-tRNA hydrolase n=1 Tax=Leptospira meyeri TaxID=29508 RepID=UPI000C2A1D7E|nr:aminoacyl-tRNA hydrolase [Leptospira meyeri]PKA26724.1 aminoacyl-tRNA hydrolase [Leptospira sp. mixed culture ATI2-C-A1]PJZ82869.1 aminoacyl-tRNA hydrolase [Leptospira meyeri]PJZ97892.1 aminoacyl-tRNA hydrolase [Leptospira meyeri]PKA12626.1 aminoacyl-tRNA hydrolase [Leptospira meyeri]TGM62777.1 aminoacyl-tRNA hydrolase [Leptospira meyeri]
MIHFLIVGLGNPGDKYKNTRHNIGFMILDALASNFGVSFKDSKKYMETTHTLEGDKVHLLKPLEFMNLSGKATQTLANLYKIPPSRILVIQDEVDLPFGKIKNKIGGGTAGHNGLKDIVAKLGSQDFHRLRFGVGKPEKGGMEVADFVLQNFNSEEKNSLDSLIKESVTKIEDWVRTNRNLIRKENGD